LGMIAILSLLAAHVCRVSSQRQLASFQETSWGESLAVAEAGADIAIAALRAGSWTGWTGPDGPNANGVRTLQTPVLSHDGEGNTSFYAVVKVDSPAAFSTSAGRFYRIRSTGTALLSGGAGRVTGEKLDNSLWRLGLKRNRDTGTAVAGAGLVSRTVEVVARPSSLFTRAITLTNAITSNSSQSYLDSFDSGDTAKSTNGIYDPTKRQQNAEIGTLDSTGSALSGMPIFGNLKYSGPAPSGTQGVTGQITTPFTQTTPPVVKPTWTTVSGSYGVITSSMNLVSGPVGSPTRYKMTRLDYAGTTIMNLQPPGAGQSGEMEIWVTGDLKVADASKIVSQTGVKVTFYIEGDITGTGTSFSNLTNRAANVTIMGVTPTDGSARLLKFTGAANFTASIYAPAYDVKFGGNGTYTGAFVAKTLDIGGNNSAIHYDEALARSGGGTQYTTASWVEDVR